MNKKETLKVLTANRLVDGEAVWFGGGQWLESLVGAEPAETPEDVAALEAIGARGIAANLVVDIALIDVERIDGDIRPLRLRERIRAAGPTFRTDLGKQTGTRPPFRAV